jgi:hypothetical protein
VVVEERKGGNRCKTWLIKIDRSEETVKERESSKEKKS